MTARLYSVGATRLLARLCKERSDAAWAAAKKHKEAALAETTQHERDVRLAYAEIAACVGRQYKRWADAYSVAAEELEEGT